MKESGSEIRDFWQDLLMICHPGWGCTWLYGCGSSSSLSAGFQPAYIIQYMMYIIYPYVYINMYIYILYIYTYWYLHAYTHLQQAGACQPPTPKTWGPHQRANVASAFSSSSGPPPPSKVQSPKSKIQTAGFGRWILDFGLWIGLVTIFYLAAFSLNRSIWDFGFWIFRHLLDFA